MSKKISTHQLTVDQSRCHGLDNCRACELVAPGLVAYVKKHGKILIGRWALIEKSATISQLADACKSKAIMVKPVESSHF